MTLLDWAEGYLRHRDIFERRIARIERDAKGLLVMNKDGSQARCVAIDELDDSVFAALGDGRSVLVTRNRKPNLAYLTKHWERFAGLQHLKVIFANVKHNEKWVLVPHSHHAIAEPESLALGLQAMFEAVPEE